MSLASITTLNTQCYLETVGSLAIYPNLTAYSTINKSTCEKGGVYHPIIAQPPVKSINASHIKKFPIIPIKDNFSKRKQKAEKKKSTFMKFDGVRQRKKFLLKRIGSSERIY